MQPRTVASLYKCRARQKENRRKKNNVTDNNSDHFNLCRIKKGDKRMKPRDIKKMSLPELLAALDKVNRDLDRIKAGLDEEVERKVKALKESMKK